MLGRILVIDDNDAIHEDFIKVLGSPPRDPGADELNQLESLIFDRGGDKPDAEIYFQIDSAFDGEHGLRMVKNAAAEGNPYALVFVDRVMPYGWDGLTTITQIWTVQPEIEIIVISAHTDESWLQILKQMGVHEQVLFLRKPFDPTVLKQMALSQMRKWLFARGAASRISNLEASLTDSPVPTVASVPAAASPSVKTEPKRMQTETVRSEHKGDILVVEDNHTNWTVLSIFLDNLGYCAHHADSGESALHQCKARQFDLIFMDLQMPGLSGFATAELLRNRVKVTCPIVAITANTDPRAQQDALKVGMEGYLTKPIRSKDLEKALNHWLHPNASNLNLDAPANTREAPQAAPNPGTHADGPEMPMDVARTIEEFLGDRALVENVTRQFLVNTRAAINQMMTACLAADYDTIGRKAHEIKGGAANLGAESLAAAAKALESAAALTDMNKVADCLPNLCIVFGRLDQYLRESALWSQP